jgi:hypothetical protein
MFYFLNWAQLRFSAKPRPTSFFFNWLALPLPTGPRPLGLPRPTVAATASCARASLAGAASAPITAGAPPPSSLPTTTRPTHFRNGRLHHHYGTPTPLAIPLQRPAAPLPLRPYKRAPWHPLLPCPSFPSLRAPSEPASSAPPPPPSPSSRCHSTAFRALVRSHSRRWPPVHGGPGWRGPPIRGLHPWVFLQRNNSWKIPFPGTLP